MPNPYFKFKQFTVFHDQCAMKVNTDGVLLGAWVTTTYNNPTRMLDIGTGSGLIALMLAQRFATSNIVAIDIDEQAAKQAKANFANCIWNDRLTAHHCSLGEYINSNTEKFDLIVSNPPYFSNSLKNPTHNRSIARHTDSLPHSELLETAANLLTPSGALCLVLPADIESDITNKASCVGLHLVKRTWVCPKVNSLPKRVLLRFDMQPGELQEDSFAIETDKRHHYTSEYRALTQNFYL